MSADDASEPDTEALKPWERNRRLRQAELDAADEHGAQLGARYPEASRQRFAIVSRVEQKRRRR